VAKLELATGVVLSKNPGRLKHGNPGGNPASAPRCGAKTRNGGKCRAPAMLSPKSGLYTRCRMHGGASTGPRTPEGLERCRLVRWKHGRRSAAATAEKKRHAEAGRKLRTRLHYFEGLLRDLSKGR
jgi:hypothetical protein